VTNIARVPELEPVAPQSEPAPAKSQPEHPARRRRRGGREPAKTVVTILLAALTTAFALLNLGDVKVNWIVSSARAPLVLVILIALAFGAVFGALAQRRFARRRR
jgi:uncharacterized integral membrane protein